MSDAPGDLSEAQPIPIGEATELPSVYGWLMWDEAVERQAVPQQPRELALEPMEVA